MTSPFRTAMLARRILAAPAASRLLPCTTTPLQLQRFGVRFQHQGVNSPYEKREKVGNKQFADFDLNGKVFVVTGALSRLFYPLQERPSVCDFVDAF
jgi:hypothetical protein